jgi:hypothetical protein
MALFIWLIIRPIQLVFSARTVFFSHKKSANSIFQPAYNSSRTTPVRVPRRRRGERGAAAIDGTLLILLCQMHARLALAGIVVLPGDSSVTVMSTLACVHTFVALRGFV